MSKSPEEIINELGGPATLNIQFVTMVREADDKGETIDENDIYTKLAKQIGCEVSDVKSALEGFWNKKS